MWVFSDKTGLAAVSTVCPHLGCIVARDAEEDTFLCPCHGSKFDRTGKVLGGPSPRGLIWIEISMGPDGRLIADSAVEVSAETRFTV